MRSFVVAALLGFATAQSSSVDATSSVLSSPLTSATPSPSTPTSSTPTPSASSILSSLFISSALSTSTPSASSTASTSANGIPTVTVLPGTYSEAVTILGSNTITIVGATATAAADWSQNQVTVLSPSIPFTIGTSSAKGVTLRNINFFNSATTSASTAAVVLSLRGDNIAFYGCSIVSPGATAISASYGLAFFANSYIEGSDKIFYNVPTAYVYKSTIVPLSSSASIVYNKGAAVGGTFYNSTVVFDSSSVQQKPGNTNTGVFLAAPNNAGAVVIYRDTAMGYLISPAGIHPSAATTSSFYGEFGTTGAGSYSQNAASRPSYDVLLTADQVSQYTIDKVYGNAFSPFGSSSLAWIDQNVVSSLHASNSVMPVVASSASSTTSSTMSVSSTVSSNSTATGSATLSSMTPSSTCSAAAASGTLVVSKNPGPCEYSNLTAAISALPNDSKPYTIQIGAGTYVEQLSITRKGKVTLIGASSFTNDYTQNQVRIEISNGVLTSAGQNEQTPVINAKKTYDNSGLAMYNIDFVNTYPQTTNTAALAADFYGANIAAYGCSFVGFQDTLLANKGTQVFSNCYIEGSVDFIWGFSAAYFHQCMIVTNTPGSCIAAQSRASADAAGGYVFDSCKVTYSSTYGSTYGLSYLGRPYSAFSIAVYMNSYIDQHIKDAGWSVWSPTNPQTSGVLFGEFNNSGPGSWQASTQRASFATNLTASQATKYQLASWIGDTTWLDMTAYNYVPSYSLTGPSSTSPSTSPSPSPNSTITGSATTATINAHPDSDGSHNATFTNLTAALASLPKDSTNQTIFMYPVRIIGSTSGNPGQSYKDNQVTITYSRGLSVSPLPVASNRISLYNINMINSDNLDGSQASYVTLAASIYGNDIAFYACSFDGWQDTLLTGATAGYQYYESCYIGGAIDFIWGYSKAYFKGCTIASSSAIGGYIFDQCLFTTAPGATDDLTNKVYLGRPYSHAINSNHVTFADNAAARTAFGYATLLTSDLYHLSSVMDSTEWIDMTFWNSIVTPQPLITAPAPINTTVTGNSTFNGTTPPAGALIVSKTPITNVITYGTIQDALNAAPTTSKTNATIFIYPGVYQEQLVLNKSGHTIFQGYSSATDDYSQNQVTIQFNGGVDTQGTTGSNTDGATNIASLGFAVKSSKFAALISGFLFTFKTYIEGNVDFIYGPGSGYFLDSTISPNEDNPAVGAGTFANIGLGRPWNNFARVAAAGWNVWSKSSPNTDGVLFSQQLSDADVVQFQLGNFFASTAFIDFDHIDTQPFAVGIGSAQACSTVSSAIISATPTSTSSRVSSSLVPTLSSIVSSSSIPAVTSTISAMISGADVTSTRLLRVTETTQIQKATATVSNALPDVKTTYIDVVTENEGRTETINEGGFTTKAAQTFTMKEYTTKPITITERQGSTGKGNKATTIKVTTSVEPTSTKTTTIKNKSLVTSCIPTDAAQRMVRRGAIIPRAARPATTTLTLSTTITSFTQVAGTKTIALPGSTTTATTTSFVKTITIGSGSTHTETITSTTQIGKTTTLKKSTTLVLTTTYVTQTSLSTITGEAVTVSNLQTKTNSETVTGEQQTVYITVGGDVTSTIRTTVPASAITKYQTITQGGAIATETVTAAAGTKTVVHKVTTTVVVWATKTAKNAKTCTE
ncbi:carbohydrate esterase family 8 protein [Cucurbitaria berberidis CBS 394.84]|uniref:pectinesterase n=1 Tax=Cucurbitaria berberidis CBS 394.84 TaxID=1168544 RepID=A0A9P4GF24_9PLEO|nr:carbohydrate esterase family 8 protein [Cucurbitaria berberidis CBS 394.84]KAF1844091.1 carbohydrate esterase family 8 protein [Cucurbitaria berberidis CBS 394.84]